MKTNLVYLRYLIHLVPNCIDHFETTLLSNGLLTLTTMWYTVGNARWGSVVSTSIGSFSQESFRLIDLFSSVLQYQSDSIVQLIGAPKGY